MTTASSTGQTHHGTWVPLAIVVDKPNTKSRRHNIHVTWDGARVYYGSCRKQGCRDCREMVATFRDLAGRHEPWVAAGITAVVHSGYADTVIAEWHGGCDCPQLPVTIDDIAPWVAVGVHRCRLAAAKTLLGWDPATMIEDHATRSGWSRATPAADAELWKSAGLKHANDIKPWKAAGYSTQAATDWIIRAGIPHSDGARWAVEFPDPELARQWWETLTGTVGLSPKSTWTFSWASVFASVGLAPAAAPEWAAAITAKPSTVVRVARATGGDLDIAVVLKRAVGVSGIDNLIRNCGDDPHAAVDWAPLAPPGPAITWIPKLIAAGITPADLHAARREGTETVQVPCSGTEHPVTVTWRNGRMTWTSVHDRQAEKVARSFGAPLNPCEAVIKDAGHLNAKVGGIHPGRVLRAAAAGTTLLCWDPEPYLQDKNRG